MMSRTMTFVFSAACVGVLVSSLQAGTVFQDNFEDTTLGVAVGLQPDAPQIGTWFRGDAQAGNTLTPSPDGGQYLASDRTAPSAPDEAMGQFIANGVTDDIIHFEFFLNVADAHPQIGLLQKIEGVTGDNVVQPDKGLILLSLYPGGAIASYENGQQGIASTWTPNVWQKWEIDYTVGATSFDLTIDGNTETVNDIITDTATTVAGIFFKGGSGSSNFAVDGVLVTGPYVPIPGDFDGDDDVDADDLFAWEGGFGTSNGASLGIGDADGDEDVDGNDFLIWQRNFTGPGPQTFAAAVPEPSSICLLLLACGTSLACRKLRRKVSPVHLDSNH